MIDKIRDNLYLGSSRDAELSKLQKLNIKTVLNVANDIPLGSGGGIKWIKQATIDDAYEMFTRGQPAIDKLIELLAQDGNVFVHCRKGRSRSPHVVAEALCSVEQRDYFDLYREIRTIRPEVIGYSIGQEIVDNNYYGKKKIQV